MTARAIAADFRHHQYADPLESLGTRGLSVANCFLVELHPGGQAKFGVDVGEAGLHDTR